MPEDFGLLLIARGSVSAEQMKNVRGYCKATRAFGVMVDDIHNSIKRIDIGQSTRILYNKNAISKETIARLSQSKPGEFIPVTEAEMEAFAAGDFGELG